MEEEQQDKDRAEYGEIYFKAVIRKTDKRT